MSVCTESVGGGGVNPDDGLPFICGDPATGDDGLCDDHRLALLVMAVEEAQWRSQELLAAAQRVETVLDHEGPAGLKANDEPALRLLIAAALEAGEVS